MCQPSKYREVVQEQISGLNSLQLPSNLAQKCLSSAANCWFECVGVFLNRKIRIHNCEIKSGSGLGMRLHVTMKKGQLYKVTHCAGHV